MRKCARGQEMRWSDVAESFLCAEYLLTREKKKIYVVLLANKLAVSTGSSNIQRPVHGPGCQAACVLGVR